MAPFAGYDMPIHYPLGVLKEHLHTRSAAGLFDVSHMGQIAVRARSGRLADAAAALERVVPADVLSLAPGRQRYAFFTNSRGGIIDDLMIGHCGKYLALVVNASRKDIDEWHLRPALSDTCTIEGAGRPRLAGVAGPGRSSGLAPALAVVRVDAVHGHSPAPIAGVSCLVSRSGYTGEDGFEIGVPVRDTEKVARSAARRSSGDARRSRRPRQPADRGRTLPLRVRFR